MTKIIQLSVVPELNKTTEISYSKQQKITQIRTAGYNPDGKHIERTVKMRYNGILPFSTEAKSYRDYT